MHRAIKMSKDPSSRCMHCEKKCFMRRTPCYLPCNHFFCSECTKNPNVSKDCRLCPLGIADRNGNIVRKPHAEVEKKERIEKTEKPRDSGVDKLEIYKGVEVKNLEVDKEVKTKSLDVNKEAKVERLEVVKGVKVKDKIPVKVNSSYPNYVSRNEWEEEESITNTMSISTVSSSFKLNLKTAIQLHEKADRVTELEEQYKALITVNLDNVFDFKVDEMLGTGKLPEIPIRKMLESANSEKQWEETFHKIVSFIADQASKRYECEKVVKSMMTDWLDTYNELSCMIDADDDGDPDESDWGSMDPESDEELFPPGYADSVSTSFESDLGNSKEGSGVYGVAKLREKIYKSIEEDNEAAVAGGGGAPPRFDWDQPTTSNCPYYVDHQINLDPKYDWDQPVTSDSALPSSSYTNMPTCSSYS